MATEKNAKVVLNPWKVVLGGFGVADHEYDIKNVPNKIMDLINLFISLRTIFVDTIDVLFR